MSPNTMNCCAVLPPSAGTILRRDDTQRILSLATSHNIASAQQLVDVEELCTRRHRRLRGSNDCKSPVQCVDSTSPPPPTPHARTPTPAATPFLMPADFYKSLLVSAAALQQRQQHQHQLHHQKKLYPNEVELQRVEYERKSPADSKRVASSNTAHFSHNFFLSAAAAAAAAQRNTVSAELLSEAAGDSNGSASGSNHVS